METEIKTFTLRLPVDLVARIDLDARAQRPKRSRVAHLQTLLEEHYPAPKERTHESVNQRKRAAHA